VQIGAFRYQSCCKLGKRLVVNTDEWDDCETFGHHYEPDFVHWRVAQWICTKCGQATLTPDHKPNLWWFRYHPLWTSDRLAARITRIALFLLVIFLVYWCITKRPL
jgi:hypothetical protein